MNSKRNEMGLEHLKSKAIIIMPLAIVVIALTAASAHLFGMTGARTVAFWAVLYVIPAYFILVRFGLSELESFVIAIFAASGTIPALVFYLNYLVPSLKWSAVIVWLLEAAAVYFVYVKVPNHEQDNK